MRYGTTWKLDRAKLLIRYCCQLTAVALTRWIDRGRRFPGVRRKARVRRVIPSDEARRVLDSNVAAIAAHEYVNYDNN